MKFVKEPSSFIQTIGFHDDGYVSVYNEGEEIPGNINRLYAGRRIWNSIILDECNLKFGKKISSISIGKWYVKGVIPILKHDNGNIECIYDWASIRA